MTDKPEAENLTDTDLDQVQGGFTKCEGLGFNDKSPARLTGVKRTDMSTKGGARYIGETEKNVVASGGGNGI